MKRLSNDNIIGSTGFIMVANYFGGAFLFVSNIMLANKFGPQDFGYFKIIISLFSFLPMLIDFGIGVTVVRYVSEYYDSRVHPLIIKLLKISLIIYIFFGILLFLLKNQIAVYFLKSFSKVDLVLAGLALFFLIYFEIFKQIVLGFREFSIYAYSQFLTFFFISACALSLGYKFGVYGAIIGWAIGYLLGNILCFMYFIKKRIWIENNNAISANKVLREYSIPNYLMTMPSSLAAAVIPILSLFFQQSLIGYLSFSMLFYQGIVTMPNSFSSVLFTKFSQLASKTNELKAILVSSLAKYTKVAVSGIILSVLFSDKFIDIFFPIYSPSKYIFKSITIYAFLAGYFFIYRSYFSSIGKFKQLGLFAFLQNFGLLFIAGIALFFTK